MAPFALRRRTKEIKAQSQAQAQALVPTATATTDTTNDEYSTAPSLTNSSSFSSSSSSFRERDVMSHRDMEFGQAQLHSFPLHSQSSLLDMTRDDSHDEDDLMEPENAFHPTQLTLSILEDDHDRPEMDVEKETITETSIMDQTEQSFVHMSETLTSSFCTLGQEVNNSCTITVPDCSFSSDSHHLLTSSKKVLFSDKILQNRLMEDLNFLLGSDTLPCCAEKSLFTNCFGSSSYDVATSSPKQTMVLHETKIRNRAGESWRARAYRVRRLREERMMQESCGAHPNTRLTLKQCSHASGDAVKMHVHGHGRGSVFRSSSFGYQEPMSSVTSSHKRSSSPPYKPKHEVNSDPLSCMIGDCIEPIAPLEGIEMEVEWKVCQDQTDPQDLCYDSDPGAYSRSKHDRIPRTSKRRVKAIHATDSSLEHRRRRSSDECIHMKNYRTGREDSFTKYYSTAHNHNHPSSHDDDDVDSIDSEFYGIHATSSQYNDESDEYHMDYKEKRINIRSSDQEIMENIQDALNHTWTLTWHPPKTNGNDKTKDSRKSIKGEMQSPPRCTQVWFERGNRIRKNDVIEPKLMWCDAYHPDLTSQRKLNTSTTQGPHKICLLSICRVLETNHIDRTKYPFAKKSCSLIIRTSDNEEVLFEASNTQQRDHLVHAWKLVVARLASQAVVGDGEGMVGEFFVSSSFGVPF